MRYDWDERGRRSRKTILSVIALIVVLYLVIVGCIYLVGKKIEEEPEEAYGDLTNRFAPTLTMEWEGKTYSYHENYYTNILLIGVDRDELEQSDGLNRNGQADFLLLLSISRNHKSITPIHIDRDTMTDVQVYGAFGHMTGTREMQICLSHAFGGTELTGSNNTVQAVSSLLSGIPIDYYVTMDMDGIAALNDALGGVTVTLEEDFSHLDPEMTQGATIRLQGVQAEYYVRGRYGIGDYTNEQRMEHQQTFIDAAIELLRTNMEEDSEFFLRLYDELSPHLRTSVPRTWLMNNTYVFENYQINPIRTLEGEHLTGEDGFMEFYPDQDALKKMLIEVYYV